MNEETEQLDWLAFCYVAEELTVADHDAFEARLATDQEAREAVEHAIQLTQLIHRAELDLEESHGVTDLPVPASNGTNGTSRMIPWAIAASLAFATLFGGWIWLTNQPGESGLASSVDSESLAVNWAETIDFNQDIQIVFDEEDQEGNVDLDDEQATSWMFAALASAEFDEISGENN